MLYGNAAYCAILACSPEELIGTTYASAIHADDRERVRLQLETMAPDNPEVVIENRVVLPSGETRWMQWTNCGCFDEAGTLIECQAAGRDITAHIEARRLVELHGGEMSESAPHQIPRRVLVIDDNEDAADMLGHLLECWGHQVRVEYSGAGAVEAAREFQPEIAFVDIGMPTMDGYETARALRGLPDLRDLALIALTGYAQDSDVAAATEAGFDHHLPKPVRTPRLRELLSTLRRRGSVRLT